MIVTVPSFTRSRLGSTQVSLGLRPPGVDDPGPALCAAITQGTKHSSKHATNSRFITGTLSRQAKGLSRGWVS